MTHSTSPAEHLRKGRDLLEESDWIQGTMKDEAKNWTGYCALGALAYANNLIYVEEGEEHWIGGNADATKNYPAIQILNDVAKEQYPDRLWWTHRKDLDEDPAKEQHNWSVVEVNDHTETKKEDILKIYDKAIVRAEEQI